MFLPLRIFPQGWNVWPHGQGFSVRWTSACSFCESRKQPDLRGPLWVMKARGSEAKRGAEARRSPCWAARWRKDEWSDWKQGNKQLKNKKELEKTAAWMLKAELPLKTERKKCSKLKALNNKHLTKTYMYWNIRYNQEKTSKRQLEANYPFVQNTS